MWPYMTRIRYKAYNKQLFNLNKGDCLVSKSKFAYCALFAALFSVNAHAATAVGDEVSLNAEFSVGTPPTQLNATWQPAQGLEPGAIAIGQNIGIVNVTGVNGDGWALYGVNGNSRLVGGKTAFTFTHEDGRTILTTNVAVSPGVTITHGGGTNAGLPGAATFIQNGTRAVLVTTGPQTLKSGVYSTQLGVQSFNN